MKARDERRVSTLRLVNAAIKNADIEAETGKKAALSDDDLLALLQKLIKQRQEAAEIYDKAGRNELAGQERGEIEIIRAFLPRRCRIPRRRRRSLKPSKRQAPPASRTWARSWLRSSRRTPARWISARQAAW